MRWLNCVTLLKVVERKDGRHDQSLDRSSQRLCEPLRRIVGNQLTTDRFAVHLKSFCEIERGPVLVRMDGEDRWKYRFNDSMIQPSSQNSWQRGVGTVEMNRGSIRQGWPRRVPRARFLQKDRQKYNTFRQVLSSTARGWTEDDHDASEHSNRGHEAKCRGSAQSRASTYSLPASLVSQCLRHASAFRPRPNGPIGTRECECRAGKASNIVRTSRILAGLRLLA